MFNLNLGMRGEYKFRARKANGEVIRETDWMPNLITDNGLDNFGAGNAVWAYCVVGEGSTPPEFTNTSLALFHQATTNIAKSNTKGTAPNYETKGTWVCTFPIQTVSKNYAEVGMGIANNGTNLWSRALIVDAGGAPTTFTVLVGEQLEVTYRLWYLPNVTDSTFTVVIAGVTYNCTCRGDSVNSLYTAIAAPQWNPVTGMDYGTWYAGPIGTILSTPSGANVSMGSGATTTADPYVAGTFYRDVNVAYGTGGANVAGGIRSCRLAMMASSGTPIGNFQQIDFGAAIPKDNTKTFSMKFRFSWGRA